MRIPVRHVDGAGVVRNIVVNATYLELSKHIAMAAMHFRPGPEKILRTLGTFLRYYHFLNPTEVMRNGRFGSPELVDDRLYDPTEKGQFTTLVGKGIADLLARRIYNANITFTYESVLRKRGLRLRGPRGDLLSVGLVNNRRRLFGVEAKGRSTVTNANRLRSIVNWKADTAKWPIHTGFDVISLAYDIYNDIKVDFVDPESKSEKIILKTVEEDELFQEYVEGVATFFETGENMQKSDIIEVGDFLVFPFGFLGLEEEKQNRIFKNWVTPWLIISKRYQKGFESFDDFLSFEPMNEIFLHQCREMNLNISKDNFYLDRDGLGILLV